jgi:ring-1,2-phenylacetyl-CoA epoxidase subunit PaaB
VIWEVFRQEREGQPFTHGGSLEAPNREFAEAYAVEFYGRRAESVALWIVPREEIAEIEEPYVADVFDRDYRRVDGYSLKVKLKEARERVAAESAGALSAEQPKSPRVGKSRHA